MVMKLDFASATPIYQQIRDQIVQAVADGAFRIIWKDCSTTEILLFTCPIVRIIRAVCR